MRRPKEMHRGARTIWKGLVVLSAECDGIMPCRWFGDVAMKVSPGSWFYWCGSAVSLSAQGKAELSLQGT
jgi:hypothetical protein